MNRPNPFLLLAAFALAMAAAPAATADEIGGSGFGVPADPGPSHWLWGIEGLVRTPVDLSASFGGLFYGYDFDGATVHVEPPEVRRSGGLEIDPSALEAGFRISGGIGYWLCCVMVEPAMAFWGNDPVGDDRTDDTPRVFDPSDNQGDEFSRGEVEVKHGWDLAFGPMMTWRVPEDHRYLGSLIGGLPVVFFPYMGVAHSEWEAELSAFDNGTLQGTFDRNFEDDSFMIGFDLDVPMLGALGPFTHALTVGFRWTDGDESHDMSQVFPGVTETRRFSFQDIEGWRVALAYRVTWNDFGGFFRRNIFGPAD